MQPVGTSQRTFTPFTSQARRQQPLWTAAVLLPPSSRSLLRWSRTPLHPQPPNHRVEDWPRHRNSGWFTPAGWLRKAAAGLPQSMLGACNADESWNKLPLADHGSVFMGFRCMPPQESVSASPFEIWSGARVKMEIFQAWSLAKLGTKGVSCLSTPKATRMILCMMAPSAHIFALPRSTKAM